MRQTLPSHDVVLLGIGHTNAHVLRMWRMKPIPDARLTCVSNFSVATYSGMLPGVLAAQYPQARMEIDLVRLCAAAGARFIAANVTGLDVAKRQLLLEGRPPLPFDVLSIGIGSVPARGDVEFTGDTLLAIKPMQTFITRLDDRLRALSKRLDGRPLRVAVVGGGAGGVEITFCFPARVRAVLGDVRLEMALINARQEVIGGVHERTAALARRELESRGVQLHLGRRATRISPAGVTLDNGELVAADLVLWVTNAVAPPLLSRLGLPTAEDGFLLTRSTLQTVADAPIFVVGDTGTIQNRSLPKAGVYAVRQGPIVWENIQRNLSGRPLQAYVPQTGFLKLLNTGDGQAIGEYKGFSFHGRWCWKLKDFIDSRFMDKYQDYRPMEARPEPKPAPGAPMRCAGCGCKISGSVLGKVLRSLDIPASEHVLLGLERPDDAAIVQSPGGRPMIVTADFFAAPLDDPYLVGRIAALNSASDVFALAGKPLAALALATVPLGNSDQQQRMLYEVLAGALEEFRRMSATLVGGHTIEGPQLTVGFTVLAEQGNIRPRVKGGLRAGDRLILTKPLGTGILLAAHMQARCRAAWMERLLPAMLLSNQAAASLVDEFDIEGLTDITGFGLAGHLLEMLQAANVSAELTLQQIPLLPGVAELHAQGVESTLAPANRTAEAQILISEPQRESPLHAVLFDPQTCGGLLMGVPEQHADAVLARLAQQSDIPSAIIGRILPPDPEKPRIMVI